MEFDFIHAVDIIDAMCSERCYLRNLEDILIDRVELSGRSVPRYFVGNDCVVFPANWRGRRCCVRCYMRRNDYLAEIYGSLYYRDELQVDRDKFTDVVVTNWVDGDPLSTVVRRCCECGNRVMLRYLSARFDDLSIDVIEGDWAHGDISGDNIIVSRVSGGVDLYLIDFDSKYIPELAGRESLSMGTQAYQSPLRDLALFDSRMDDFSLALISVSLRALAIDPTLAKRFDCLDSLLLDGEFCRAESYELLSVVIDMLAREGDFVGYRMARELSYGSLHIELLHEWLSYRPRRIDYSRVMVSGRWYGFGDGVEWAIPPLFDVVSEFRAGEAEVEVAKWRFRIDRSGRIVARLGRGNLSPQNIFCTFARDKILRR